ncbi:MAG: hypothetical protein GC164_12855 [Phycisphaera sp.]|nr:hypothetical protein [Phycisphaera sp.]
MASGQTLRIGVVGCGRHAREVQLPLLVAMERVEVVALYHRSEAGLNDAGKLAPGAKTFKKWETLVGDASVDAVVSTLPPAFNLPLVKAATEARKPVWIETPVASDEEDLATLARMAQRSGVHVQVGTQLLFGEWYRLFESAVISLGDVLAVESRVVMGDEWVFEPMSWKVDHASSGGILNTWGVHALTMLLKLAAGGGRRGYEADYAEVTAFTGSAYSREAVDPAMYDTASCAWMTLGKNEQASPCSLLLCAHPGVREPLWKTMVVCDGGRVEGDFYARTVTSWPRGGEGRVVTLPAYDGPGFDGNREALSAFVLQAKAGQADLSTLQLAATACRFALEVNVNPTLDDEDEDGFEDDIERSISPPPRPSGSRRGGGGGASGGGTSGGSGGGGSGGSGGGGGGRPPRHGRR